jgi:hypothetical protein
MLGMSDIDKADLEIIRAAHEINKNGTSRYYTLKQSAINMDAKIEKKE